MKMIMRLKVFLFLSTSKHKKPLKFAFTYIKHYDYDVYKLHNY